MQDSPQDANFGATAQETILVAVSGGPDAEAAVNFAKTLADALNEPWTAIHVQTPSNDGDGPRARAAGDALGLAARLGASIATVPAPSVVDGLCEQLEGSAIRHVVLGHRGGRARWPWQRPVLDALIDRASATCFHVLPAQSGGRRRRSIPGVGAGSLLDYGSAAAMVAATLIAAILLHRATGVRSLSVLFLFPVIAAAARLGVVPALFAALLAAAGYNFAFLEPILVPKPASIQSWVMAAALAIVGVYTGGITATLRGRAALSDRSARENAGLAAFSQRLASVSGWTSTAEAVCGQVSAMLDVNSVLLREVAGQLEVVASVPAGAELGPVDRAALEWAWSHGIPAGRGTDKVAVSEWQFQPLKTSLGMLAILGLARSDSADPVRPDKALLLSTLIAQAALAHERLRLEDDMRAGVR